MATFIVCWTVLEIITVRRGELRRFYCNLLFSIAEECNLDPLTVLFPFYSIVMEYNICEMIAFNVDVNENVLESSVLIGPC